MTTVGSMNLKPMEGLSAALICTPQGIRKDVMILLQ